MFFIVHIPIRLIEGSGPNRSERLSCFVVGLANKKPAHGRYLISKVKAMLFMFSSHTVLSGYGVLWLMLIIQ